MKYSIVSACVASLLVAVVAVQASYYSPRHSNYPGNYRTSHHGSSAAHYSGSSGLLAGRGCTGYNCNSRHVSATGPYHSYAVRPAIYGGHGLYKYRGYARHPVAQQSHYRQVRSCNGYNCNRGSSGYSHGSSHSQLNYNLRPINALVVHPVYRPAPTGHHNYHHAAPNRHLASASGYGRGAHSSSYSVGSHHARRQPVSAGY